MRIDAITIHRVSMPLVTPFNTAFGDTTAVESVLVRLQSGAVSGWGEAAPWRFPEYSPESAASAFVTGRDMLAPIVLGTDIPSGADLQRRFSRFKGNQFAKAAFDLAWWDLAARLAGTPLHRMLGGTRTEVEVGADFGVMESVDALLSVMRQAVDAGFKRIKLKYRPGWDLDMLTAVRAAFPDTVIHVDCNSAYRLADIPMLEQLDRFGLAMIEQPLANDDLIDHAVLQKRVRTPICLDESITSVDKARKAIDLGACGWINIKPGRVGGITNAVAIHDLCAARGVPCWIGGMLESAVGGAHCLALATLPNIRYPSDIFPTDRFYARDLATPDMRLSAPSVMRVSEDPGIGTIPDEAMLARLSVEQAHLVASNRPAVVGG
ncbi:MAG: o-succinylbenzoate synthase [Planctomycetes bacterium]|nr:o-succinylbenzoate synthase [Planctomycetota bacterium]